MFFRVQGVFLGFSRGFFEGLGLESSSVLGFQGFRVFGLGVVKGLLPDPQYTNPRTQSRPLFPFLGFRFPHNTL